LPYHSLQVIASSIHRRSKTRRCSDKHTSAKPRRCAVTNFILLKMPEAPQVSIHYFNTDYRLQHHTMIGSCVKSSAPTCSHADCHALQQPQISVMSLSCNPKAATNQVLFPKLSAQHTVFVTMTQQNKQRASAPQASISHFCAVTCCQRKPTPASITSHHGYCR
jgi:hypothetical protein